MRVHVAVLLSTLAVAAAYVPAVPTRAARRSECRPDCALCERPSPRAREPASPRARGGEREQGGSGCSAVYCVGQPRAVRLHGMPRAVTTVPCARPADAKQTGITLLKASEGHHFFSSTGMLCSKSAQANACASGVRVHAWYEECRLADAHIAPRASAEAARLTVFTRGTKNVASLTHTSRLGPLPRLLD